MSVTIYILRLQNKKYYVGKTIKKEKRLADHFNGTAAEWTRLYKPLEVIETIENMSPFDEDKYVKVYMQKYGIDNVRGGTYNQIVLMPDQINALQQELRTVSNACFKCGSTNHFVARCPLKIKRTKTIGQIIDEYIEYFFR